jgi:hypothetical protein
MSEDRCAYRHGAVLSVVAPDPVQAPAARSEARTAGALLELSGCGDPSPNADHELKNALSIFEIDIAPRIFKTNKERVISVLK